MISLACVNINERTIKNVNEALQEGRIGQGRFITEFQDKMKEYFGVKYAFFVANGTLADAVALASLKILKPNKNEVIMPAFTFVAQANSVLMAGLKPVFVDADIFYQIDTQKIEEKITDKTLAIFPAHLIGIPSNIRHINQIAFDHNLFVVEDTCESFGASYEDMKLGTWGDIGTFSFFVSHILTIGEGGLIITNNDKIAEVIRSVMNHGRKSEELLEKFQFPYFGFNAKGTNLAAAIGCSVVDTINEVVKKRQENVKYLNDKSLAHFPELDNTSPHCYPINARSKEDRDKMILKLNKAGIECRTFYNSIPNNTHFSCGERYSNALEFSTNYYYIPIHQNLIQKDLDYMVEQIRG